MLITHVPAGQLLGMKVYDTHDCLLGEVVAVGMRHGVVRRVAVRHNADQRAQFIGAQDARLGGEGLVVVPRPRLEVVE